MTYQIDQNAMRGLGGSPVDMAAGRLASLALSASPIRPQPVKALLPAHLVDEGIPDLAEGGVGRGVFYVELPPKQAQALDSILCEGDYDEDSPPRLPRLAAAALRLLFPDSWSAIMLNRRGDKACGLNFMSSDMAAVLGAMSTGARIYFEPAAVPLPIIPEAGETGLHLQSAPLARAFMTALAADSDARQALANREFDDRYVEGKRDDEATARAAAACKLSLAALAVACGKLDSGFFDFAGYDDNDSVAASKISDMLEMLGRDGRKPIDFTAKLDAAGRRKMARLARRLDSHALVQIECAARWNGSDGKGDVESEAAAQAERDAMTPAEREAHAQGGAPWTDRR